MTQATLPIHTERYRHEGCRYDFDFGVCNYKKGWAQCDTGQDASYFGIWANPARLQVVTFAEGDVTVATASNPDEFVAEIRRIAQWGKDSGWGFKIDGMCDEGIIQRFADLGLADLLH